MKILNILQMPWKYSPVEEVDSVNKGKENNLYILRDTQAKKKNPVILVVCHRNGIYLPIFL